MLNLMDSKDQASFITSLHFTAIVQVILDQPVFFRLFDYSFLVSVVERKDSQESGGR